MRLVIVCIVIVILFFRVVHATAEANLAQHHIREGTSGVPESALQPPLVRRRLGTHEQIVACNPETTINAATTTRGEGGGAAALNAGMVVTMPMRSNPPCVDRLGIMRCKEVVISPCVHLKGVVECRELETESWSVKVQWSVKVNVEALLGHNRGREKQRSQFHFTSQNFCGASRAPFSVGLAKLQRHTGQLRIRS